MRPFRWVLTVVFMGSLQLFSHAHGDDSLSVTTSPVPQTTAQLRSADISIPLGDKIDIKQLRVTFIRALESESRALQHRQKLELRELRESQKARKKDFERREKEARRKYFKETSEPKSRRQYVQDFQQRRRSLLEIFKLETKTRASDHQVRRESLDGEQKNRLKEFDDSLKTGMRPAETLWPASGG